MADIQMNQQAENLSYQPQIHTKTIFAAENFNKWVLHYAFCYQWKMNCNILFTRETGNTQPDSQYTLI